MQFLPGIKANTSVYITAYVLITLHLVGVIGLSYTPWQPTFQLLTPFNLLFSALLVFGTSQALGWRLGLFALLAISIGFTAEAVGVATGWPFGNYKYGHALGPQWLNVPFVIGLNWALLVYCSGVIAKVVSKNMFVRAALGAALMVIIDLPIEPVAPRLDFWYWADGHAPFINFVGWYVVAFVLQLIFNKLVPDDANKVAWVYAGVVFTFFLALNFLV